MPARALKFCLKHSKSATEEGLRVRSLVLRPRAPAPLMVEVVFSKKELVVSMLVSHCFIQENARLIPLWQFLTLILELILCK